MAYKDLSVKERHAIIRAGVANGVHKLSDIEAKYDAFVDPANHPDYDIESYARENPSAVFNHDGHYPDTYKMPNHPSFSEESIYSTPQTPGGRWGRENGQDYFEPSEWQVRQYGLDNIRRGVEAQEGNPNFPVVYGGGRVLPEVTVQGHRFDDGGETDIATPPVPMTESDRVEMGLPPRYGIHTDATTRTVKRVRSERQGQKVIEQADRDAAAVNEQKEWLRNWYAKRLPALGLEGLQENVDRGLTVPYQGPNRRYIMPQEYAYKTDRNDAGVYYHPGYKENSYKRGSHVYSDNAVIVLNQAAGTTTPLHEYTHATQYGGGDYYNPKFTGGKDVSADSSYYASPDEQHARIMQLRYMNNLDPEKRDYTEDDLRELEKDYRNWPILQDLKKGGMTVDTFLDALNNWASNDKSPFDLGNGRHLSAEGGGIHIAPSKRGTFTAAATKHGKSVQAFASQVLANKDNYSPAMVKKANFARNAAHWHDNGGETINFPKLGIYPTYDEVENSPYKGIVPFRAGDGLTEQDKKELLSRINYQPKSRKEIYEMGNESLEKFIGDPRFATYRDAMNAKMAHEHSIAHKNDEMYAVPYYDENGKLQYKNGWGSPGHMELGFSDPLFIGLTGGMAAANGALSSTAQLGYKYVPKLGKLLSAVSPGTPEFMSIYNAGKMGKAAALGLAGYEAYNEADALRNFKKDPSFGNAVTASLSLLPTATPVAQSINRRASLFMPNLRASVYNNVVPYGYQGHAKEAFNIFKDNVSNTLLKGKSIKPFNVEDKYLRWFPGGNVTGGPSREFLARDFFLRDRLGLPVDYDDVSSVIRNNLNGELPYIIDATTSKGTHVVHYNPKYEAIKYKGGDRNFLTDQFDPELGMASIEEGQYHDVLTGAGGGVGMNTFTSGNKTYGHMFDRWDTAPLEHFSNFKDFVPFMSEKTYNRLPSFIRKFDPIDLVSVRPATIQSNVNPAGNLDYGIFEKASSEYNKANADAIESIFSTGGPLYPFSFTKPIPAVRYAEGGPTRNWDNTLTGKLINYVENSDSIGWNPADRTWEHPTKPGYDKNQIGMGVDKNETPGYWEHIQYRPKTKVPFMSEADERTVRHDAIEAANKSANARYKFAQDTLNRHDGTVSRIKDAAVVSAIYNLGAGTVANGLFEDRDFMKLLFDGTDKEVVERINQEYLKKKRRERVEKTMSYLFGK